MRACEIVVCYIAITNYDFNNIAKNYTDTDDILEKRKLNNSFSFPLLYTKSSFFLTGYLSSKFCCQKQTLDKRNNFM